MTLIGFLAILIVVCIIFGVAFYWIQRTAIPEPFNWIVPVLLALLFIVVLLTFLPLSNLANLRLQ